MPANLKDWLPEAGWPVYDLRRKKFGICTFVTSTHSLALVHIEGYQNAMRISLQENEEFEYPKFYDGDEVYYKPISDEQFHCTIKHTHYHVTRDIWVFSLGVKGTFDTFQVNGWDCLTLINRFIPKL